MPIRRTKHRPEIIVKLLDAEAMLNVRN